MKKPGPVPDPNTLSCFFSYSPSICVLFFPLGDCFCSSDNFFLPDTLFILTYYISLCPSFLLYVLFPLQRWARYIYCDGYQFVSCSSIVLSLLLFFALFCSIVYPYKYGCYCVVLQSLASLWLATHPFSSFPLILFLLLTIKPLHIPRYIYIKIRSSEQSIEESRIDSKTEFSRLTSYIL